MKLTLDTEYKSLKLFTKDELPALTIFTGINGAGKTHILTAISENQIKATEEDIELTPQRYVTNQTLLPNDGEMIVMHPVNQAARLRVAC